MMNAFEEDLLDRLLAFKGEGLMDLLQGGSREHLADLILSVLHERRFLASPEDVDMQDLIVADVKSRFPYEA